MWLCPVSLGFIFPFLSLNFPVHQAPLPLSVAKWPTPLYLWLLPSSISPVKLVFLKPRSIYSSAFLILHIFPPGPCQLAFQRIKGSGAPKDGDGSSRNFKGLTKESQPVVLLCNPLLSNISTSFGRNLFLCLPGHGSITEEQSERALGAHPERDLWQMCLQPILKTLWRSPRNWAGEATPCATVNQDILCYCVSAGSQEHPSHHVNYPVLW